MDYLQKKSIRSVAAAIAGFLRHCVRKIGITREKLPSCIALAVCPLVTFYLFEMYTHNPFTTMHFKTQILNMAFYVLTALLLFGIVKYVRVALMLQTAFFMAAGLANYYVLNFRSAPIMPWDIYSIGTAASVAGNFNYTLKGSIERRVRHLRDTADDNGIERALCIEVRAAAAFNRAMVLRQQRLSRIRIAHRMNGIVRADLFADTAAAAEIREARDLLDDRTYSMNLLRLRYRLFRYRQRLAADCYLDGFEGAGSDAAAAHRAAVGMIFDYPGEIVDSHILSLYCFHLCTSRSLSMTTISRSFG